MPCTYRYAGPDGEGARNLPEGVGCAIGSEYCVHLLPSAGSLASAAETCIARDTPLLLLTPYFRDGELKRLLPLFRAIPGGADVDVAVNDWGALLVLRALFPGIRRSVGRLLSGQKRCPRIGASPRLNDAGRAWHGEGLFSSAKARSWLGKEMGVSGYHVDSLPWGPQSFGTFPDPGDGTPRLYVHSPYAVVTVSDSCPWIGGASSASLSSCPRSCRQGPVRLREVSMGGDMLQRGKARFHPVRLDDLPPGVSAKAHGLVYYEDLP